MTYLLSGHTSFPPRSGLQAFLDLNGADGLLRTIQEGRSNPRLRTKACFFVSVVAAEDTRIKEEFSKMGFARYYQQIDLPDYRVQGKNPSEKCFGNST